MTVTDENNLPLGDWKDYRKTTTTRMLRMDGPFAVQTLEGLVDCPDGWLAVDTQGHPYPVAATIHDQSYEEVGE